MADKVQDLIERMKRERGFSRPWHGRLARLDPDFMDLYHKRVKYVYNQTKALPRKVTELLGLCGNAAEFYEAGFRTHLREALKAGATQEEVLEALEVCTLVGTQNRLSMLLPVFEEEARRYAEEQVEGQQVGRSKLIERTNEDQEILDTWRPILAERDPLYMQIYDDIVTYVFEQRNVLPRKTKEIIAAYLNAAVTCSESGFRFHVRKALRAGATEEEIFEMITLVASRGIHTLSRLLDPLQEEVEDYEKSHIPSHDIGEH